MLSTDATGTGTSRAPLTLQPRGRLAALDPRELWRFRELLWTLAARDVKLRYKQTLLGVTWVVLQPLIAAGVLAFVFGRVAGMDPGDTPYFLLAFTGFLGFSLFQSTLNRSSQCLVGNAPLVSKVYFPRLTLPLSVVPSALVDFLVGAAVALALVLAYDVPPTWRLLTAPLWVAHLVVLGLGPGLAASTLAVSYRDIGHVLPVASQVLLYATPVAYPLEEVLARTSEPLRTLYLANPVVAPVSGLRWAVLATPPPSAALVGQSLATTALLALLGLAVFTARERRFADVI